MNLVEILQQLGIEEREANVYLANLEMGPASAKEIAQKAGIQRTYFYDISEKLIGCGIMKQIKKVNKRFFTVCEPEMLLSLQEQKLTQFKQGLPQLKAIQNTSGEKPKVHFYEKRSGINQINNDTLQYKGEIVGFTTPRFVSVDDEKLSREYIGKRIASGIKARVIGEVSEEMLKLKKLDSKELRETRMLPKNIYSSQVELGIYGNKCYFINYRNEFGLIIEDSEISRTLKNIFEIIWSSGKIIE